ncbi:MAG TPA: ZIP family metal transporter [Acidimicrobiales bacterium]|nr:ZIP family metal transporter [Acidimicrobiales bacterium]
MDESRTLLLGAIAGATILLGLPLGRLRAPRPALRLWLSSLATGILVFLIWDVFTAAYAPLDGALSKLHSGAGGMGPVLGYGALFLGGTGIGLLSLAHQENLMARLAARGARPVPVSGPGSDSGDPASRRSPGPGAVAADELVPAVRGMAGWSPARRLSFLIAVGIGLHNFGEGLAIGESAAAGAIGLATVLVIGFALHNATEGFGIVAPLAAERERPSWGQLLVLAAIGGGPTFIGTIVGHAVTNRAMAVVFLTLAAGSILYVVVQLIRVGTKAGRPSILYWGIFAGLVAGFVTDMVVSAGGA